jgi:hypothetical protein
MKSLSVRGSSARLHCAALAHLISLLHSQVCVLQQLVRVSKRYMWRYRLTEQVPVLAQVIGESTRKKRSDAAARDDAPSLYYLLTAKPAPSHSLHPYPYSAHSL